MALGLTAAIVAVALAAGACQEAEPEPDPAVEARERTRAAIVAGARRDFERAVPVPRPFVRCVLRGLRAELDREALEWLGAVLRGRDRPAAARGLNTLAAPVGDRCGERWLVPQLIEAARGLPRR